MEIRFATLADTANVSREGKLNITGIFSRINSHAFPSTHAGATLVVILDSHPAEAGEHALRILFVDQDGNSSLSIEVSFTIPEGSIRGLSAAANFILSLPPIPMQAPGDYSFDIFLDGRYEYRVPIQLAAAT